MEGSFDVVAAGSWMHSQHGTIFLIDVVYVGFCLIGPRLIRKMNHPFGDLRTMTAMWNGVNSLASFVMLSTFTPNLWRVARRGGWQAIVCDNAGFYTELWSGTTMFVFALSKVWELGDTVFLMLRGRSLQFLHVYHHAVTLLYVVWTYPTAGSVTAWGAWMNCLVHSVMYPYFTIQTLRPGTLPRSVASLVTTLQISQFAAACLALMTVSFNAITGRQCDADLSFMGLHYFVYGSFLVLFCRFFVRSYLMAHYQKIKQ